MSSVVFKKHDNTLLTFLYGEKNWVKINYFVVAADAESIADSLWELKKKSAISKYFL